MGNGELYEKLNFKRIAVTPPNYWYLDNTHNTRIYRFNFRKDQLSKKLANYDVKLSEWQNMQRNGYDRIWDCGHIKYEWLAN